MLGNVLAWRTRVTQPATRDTSEEVVRLWLEACYTVKC
jgi:hypothetical protein